MSILSGHNNLGEEKELLAALDQLAHLKEIGAINEEEYTAEKNKILHPVIDEIQTSSKLPANKRTQRKKFQKLGVYFTVFAVVIIAGYFMFVPSHKDRLNSLVEAVKHSDTASICKLLQGDSSLARSQFPIVAYASKNNRKDIVELLLRYKTLTSGYDDDGYTALAYAAQNGDTTLTRLLVQANALVDVGKKAPNDTLTFTPLMLASQHGRPETAQILLSSGAEVNKKNEANKTAMDYAVEAGRPKVITVLLRNGAVTKIPESMTIRLGGRIANVPVTFIMYVSGSGSRIASEISSGYGGFRFKYVNDNDYEYTIDMNTRTGVRHLKDNDNSRLKGINLDNIINNYNSYNLSDVSIDTTLFAGKPCQILSMKDYSGNVLKIWSWSGILLKMIAWTGNSESINVKVQKIEENANIPESRFKVPPGIQITN